ncbi:MAG TPA: amidohydrolase family protein [Actinomycetospora sp.]|nr:amidohydrolase family protein [Actinomycetospora sp.]
MTDRTVPDLHVRGVVLPEGEHQDLWIRDGRLTGEPVPGAETVATGWVLPGLVDLHCHVGLDAHGAVPPDVAEQQALTDRDAGVLLIRDAGSPADTRWMDDRADLPRIVRAGRHLARTRRYIRNYGHEIEPDELVAYVEQEAARGDGWVKLVGDWIDRELGVLGPCWPAPALAAAIGRAHELGARVTAHVFGDAALPDLIGAGIDCIEHGTGLSPDLAAEMARRGVAVVPTLVNIENFPGYADAGEERFPAYAAQMRELHAQRYDTVRTAYESGVPVYVGTDAGGVMPHGLAAREVLELVRAGLPRERAVGAASWDARAFLLGDHGGLVDGGPADLVVVAEDPRVNPATLLEPLRIVLRGRVVR